MSLYLRLRRWVDAQWVEGLGYKSLIVVTMLPFLLIPVVGLWWIWPAAVMALAWSTFIGWRGYRLARANDAHFDRKTKYMLSKEYHTTESAMKASWQRKRNNG